MEIGKHLELKGLVLSWQYSFHPGKAPLQRFLLRILVNTEPFNVYWQNNQYKTFILVVIKRTIKEKANDDRAKTITNRVQLAINKKYHLPKGNQMSTLITGYFYGHYEALFITLHM